MLAAGIDIGTNTCLMVIADVQPNGSVVLISDEHAIGRLGEGVSASGSIKPEAVERTNIILNNYNLLLKKHNVQKVYCVTTSAMRDAANSAEVKELFQATLGFPVHIIDGEEEGRLTFAGSGEGSEPILLMDIGGGSTEFIAGSNRLPTNAVSLQVGAVRLTEMFFASLPPTAEEINKAKEFLLTLFSQHQIQQTHVPVWGVGGTFTTLAALHKNVQVFNPSDIHGTFLPIEQVRQLCMYICSLSAEQLRTHPAIHPQRADILPAGAFILLQALEFMSAKGCYVSVKGLRYGALLQAAGVLQ